MYHMHHHLTSTNWLIGSQKNCPAKRVTDARSMWFQYTPCHSPSPTLPGGVQQPTQSYISIAHTLPNRSHKKRRKKNCPASCLEIPEASSLHHHKWPGDLSAHTAQLSTTSRLETSHTALLLLALTSCVESIHTATARSDFLCGKYPHWYC